MVFHFALWVSDLPLTTRLRFRVSHFLLLIGSVGDVFGVHNLALRLARHRTFRFFTLVVARVRYFGLQFVLAFTHHTVGL